MKKLVELRKFRESTGLSQFNMAVKLNVSLSMYEKIERGHAEPSRGFMQRLKFTYPEISIDDIFFNDEVMEKVVI